MPLSADPNETIEYSLKCDLDKPIESRPVFICRFMTYSDHRRIRKLREDANAQPNTEVGAQQTYTLLCEAIKIGVVGWRNFPKDYPCEIGDILGELDIWELVYGYPGATRMAEVDLKKSSPPAQPDSAASTAVTSPTPAQ